MPHKCMECKNLIESGTIDLQKGCPICGGKKFQYIRPKPRTEVKPTVAEYVARAALREPPEGVKEPRSPGIPEEKPREPPAEAKAPLVKPAVIGIPDKKPREPPVKDRPAPDQAPLKKPETRLVKKGPPEKSGDRVESIRVVEQGTYDINLPLLLSRKELIMSKEEGNYIVDLNSVLKKKRRGRKK